MTQSNTTDDENGFQLSHSDKTTDGEDEVFITQVSPDTSSSGFERASISQQHSNTNTSIESGSVNTGTSSGVVMVTDNYKPNNNDKVQSVTNGLNCDNHDNNNSSSSPVVDGEQSIKSQIHLDLEILQEIDRQNCITSPMIAELPNNEPYISMNPAPTPIRNSFVPTRSSSHASTPTRDHSPMSLISVHSPKRSLSLKLPQPQSHSAAATVLRTGSCHQYTNIPTSFIRIPSCNNNTSNQSINYRVVPGIPIGFIKRVLSRSSEACPANLKMVAITNQEADNVSGKAMVKLGEKVLGLYLDKDDVIVETVRGEKGRLPYSFCRISKSFYGSNSKVIKYSSLSLYRNSTSCIELCGHTPSSIPITMVAVKQYDAIEKDELSVKIGEQVVVLYSDNQWVFGKHRRHGNNGFIPRECCRLTRRSTQLLMYTKWLIPSLMFQSDFVFSLHEAPPKYLIMHPLFPGKSQGTIVMVTRNYTPPGTQVVIRKGVCVKVIYAEDYFVYVATITGSSFWVPVPFVGPAPKTPRLLPMMLPSTIPVVLRSQTSPSKTIAPDYASLKFRNSCESDKSTPRKKVSFAAKNYTMFRNSMGSNPELNLSGLNSTNPMQQNDGYAVIPPTRASKVAGSHENIPVYLLFDNCPSPIVASKSFCGCFKF